MILSEFKDQYILCDGSIKGIEIQYGCTNEQRAVTLNIQLRKTINNLVKPINVAIELHCLSSIVFIEDNLYEESFTDIKFLAADGRYYISLDPYDNSQHKHPKDNMVFEFGSFSVVEK